MEVVKELRKIESDLLEKLDAVRKVISLYDKNQEDKFANTEVYHTQSEEPKVRIKVKSLPQLIEICEKMSNYPLNSKEQHSWSLSLYAFNAKIMFPKMGYADIGMLVSSPYQNVLNAYKRHEKLISENSAYFKINQQIQTKYSIKEIILDL